MKSLSFPLSFQITFLFALLATSSSFSNEDRERASRNLEKAEKALVEIERIALQRPGTPSMPPIAEAEGEHLKEANSLFKEFAAHDCLNQNYKEGAVGGSALGLGVTLCRLDKTNQRIKDLAERYDIKLVYQQSE